MFGANIGSGLVSNPAAYRYSMCINRTGLEFITSDLPMANIHSQPTVELTHYYPLSPQRAIIVSNTRKYPVHYEMTNPETVDSLNRHIIEGAHENVFASRAETLHKYRACYLKARC